MDKNIEPLLEEYRERISAAYAHAEQVIQSQPKLDKRDAMLLEASSIRLIPVPVHLAQYLEDYDKMVTEAQQLETQMYTDYGVVYDQPPSAYSLLRQQPWWLEFIGFVRQELNISDANDIGRWETLFKKLAPYQYDIVLVYQNPQQYADNKPVSSWTWRVNLLNGSIEAV
ncbi:hypothetical protein ACFLV0_06965 [Chloroflexota bacterium]